MQQPDAAPTGHDGATVATITRWLARFGRADAHRPSNTPPGEARWRFADLLASGDGSTASRDDAAAEPAVRHTLRIGSGLHHGASIELVDAVYRIGRSSDCDLVLRDAAIGTQRWCLTREADGYCLHAGDAASGPRVAPRPRRDGDGDDVHEIAFDLNGIHVMLARRPVGCDAPARSAPASRWHARYVVPVVLGVAITTFAWAAVRWHEAHSIVDVAQRVVSGSQALVEQGFDSVRFRRGRAGELEVAGVVAGAAERARLQAWLARSTYADARSTVQQADSLVDQVRQTLSGESLRISHRGSQVRIDGTTSKAAVKTRIRVLADELRGIVEIDDRVAYVDPNAKPRGPGPLSIRVRDVMVGSPSWFRTDTGALYFEGAVLPDGAEVLEIEPTQIRFRLADKIVVFPLG